MNGAIHEDIVLAEVFASGVRKEAKVIRIIKRELKNLVGEILYDDKGRAYIDFMSNDLTYTTADSKKFVAS